jgi:hypothetical protein
MGPMDGPGQRLESYREYVLSATSAFRAKFDRRYRKRAYHRVVQGFLNVIVLAWMGDAD